MIIPYKRLVGISERMRTFGRVRRRREYNIRMGFKGCEDVDCTCLAQYRVRWQAVAVVKTVINL
jgi:hypothetical protein